MQTSPIVAGFDGGNGSTKLVIDGLEYRAPAYCHVINSGFYEVADVPDGALVEYVEGSRVDLCSQTWLTGSAAWYAAPDTTQQVVNDRQGKLAFGLQLLLGAIAALDYQPNWNISLVASIHDAEAFGQMLTEALQGSHKIRLQDGRYSQVNIKVLQICEEGVGALVEATAKKVIDVKTSQNILFDFGHGTTIASVFGPGGKLLERFPHAVGVEGLFTALAGHVETRRAISRYGNPELFRRAIENRTFTYGSTGWNFSPIYKTELINWARENLAAVLKSVDEWSDSSDARLAVGGGAQLPAIADLLAAKGIKAIENPTLANARGLYRLAGMKLSAVGAGR